MENTQHDKIIDEICDYAEKNEIKAMLQEYMKRLILEQPADPLNFLIQSIQSNPYRVKSAESGSASASASYIPQQDCSPEVTMPEDQDAEGMDDEEPEEA